MWGGSAWDPDGIRAAAASVHFFTLRTKLLED